MIGILKTRIQQGYRTMAYPAGPLPELPARFAGRPVIEHGASAEDGRACAGVCPTGAMQFQESPGRLTLDMGRCLFCGACRDVCGSRAVRFSRDHRLAAACRDDLMVDGTDRVPAAAAGDALRRLFGRSLKLRQVSAGGCNACEADINVLGTLAWDLGRFGIQFVASPRHADGLVVTGPVTRNMELALRKTYEAIPAPKIVIAVGACAISGGLFAGHGEAGRGVAEVLPVDLFIPGCPPHPATILDGLLRWSGRLQEPAGSGG